MKKVLLSIMFASVASFASAQKSEVNEAKKAWTLMAITSGKPLSEHLKALNDGLAHTDLAIANEKSMNMPEAWSYRALLASRIALVDSVDLNNGVAKQKIAEESIIKAQELDKKGSEKENIDVAKQNVEAAVRNRAVYAYNTKNFAAALDAFNEVTKRNPTDTGMYVNAGIMAKEVGNYPEVLRNFKKAIELNYADSKTLYSEIIGVTLDKLKDTVAGLSLIKEASTKFPGEALFITAETDIYLKQGDVQKSQDMLKKLIESNPENPHYQYLMGQTYFNQAVIIQNERNAVDVKDKKKFDDLTTKMTKLIDDSVPYLKKALELDPKNANALENLKIIYLFKNDTANYDEMKKRLDAIEQ